MKSETNSISERTALNLAYGPSSTLFLFATDIMYGWFQIKRITYMRNAIFRSHLHFLLHEYTQLWECDWIFGLKLKFYIFPIIFFFTSVLLVFISFAWGWYAFLIWLDVYIVFNRISIFTVQCNCVMGNVVSGLENIDTDTTTTTAELIVPYYLIVKLCISGYVNILFGYQHVIVCDILWCNRNSSEWNWLYSTGGTAL